MAAERFYKTGRGKNQTVTISKTQPLKKERTIAGRSGTALQFQLSNFTDPIAKDIIAFAKGEDEKVKEGKGDRGVQNLMEELDAIVALNDGKDKQEIQAAQERLERIAATRDAHERSLTGYRQSVKDRMGQRWLRGG
jgi:hypothetical protein